MKKRNVAALLISLFALFFLTAFSACPAPLYAASTEPVAFMPLSIAEPDTLLSEARYYYKQKDYLTAINRLESYCYIKQSFADDVREMLIEALAKQIDLELSKSDYKNAASYNIKIITLKSTFDFVWINKLLNIYMLSGNYRKTHELCLEILKKQDLIMLNEESLAKIYGKLSVVYATFRDISKSMESLVEAASKDPDIKAIKSYTRFIFPAHLQIKSLADYAASCAGGKKFREAYISAYIHSKISERPDAEIKALIDALISKNPEFKSIFMKSQAAEEAFGNSTDESRLASAEAWSDASDTSIVVLANVPAQLKNVPPADAPSRSGGENFDLCLLRADELFEKQKYEDAIAEYETAKKIATSDEIKKDIDRKIFSAYWYTKESYIKYSAYILILIAMVIFFYYYNPLSLLNREQYGLINVAKTLRTGVELVNDKKYQKAISELEKLVDMKLSTTETVMLYLNLGAAYYNINSYASALMALKKVLQYEYENVEAYKFLGRIYLKTKDRSYKAMEVFNYLIERKLADIDMLKAVLNYNVAQNIIDERAVQIATDVLAVEGSNEPAGRFIVKYFNKVKRFDDEALKFIEKFVENYPRDVESHIVLLETVYRRKDFKRIVNDSNILFAYAIDNVLIHSLFIDSIVNLNKPQMLVSEYERLLHENPGSLITNFIYQSFKSLIVDKKRTPQVDYAVAVRVNFGVCHKCFHLNLNDFNNCQRCGSALKI